MSHIFIRIADGATKPRWQCMCGLVVEEWRMYSGQLPPCRRGA